LNLSKQFAKLATNKESFAQVAKFQEQPLPGEPALNLTGEGLSKRRVSKKERVLQQKHRNW